MITKIVLNNFLSYEKAVVEFDGSTIAVVGENGHGKSAFLEAIPYAYFGIGRETKEGMSRINGDGSHRVEVWEQDNLVFIRGRKPGGAGYCEVRIDGELKAKGGDAGIWIENYLGMNSDTFMLTAFFGLGDTHSDKLLKVLPSARLEAMQSLAQIGPYKSLLKKAKTKYDEAERLYATERARMEGAKEALGDDKKLQEGLSAGLKLITDADNTLKKLKEERRNLQIEEETYHAFVREKERVGVERHNLRKEIDKKENKQAELEESLVDSSETIVDTRNGLDKCTKELSELDCNILAEKLGNIQRAFGAAKLDLELKKSALNVSLGDAVECPLCGQSVVQEIVDTWAVSVTALQEKLNNLHDDDNIISDQLAQVGDLQESVATLDQEIKVLSSNAKKDENEIKGIKKELVKLLSQIKKKDDRYVFLVEKLGDEYQGLKNKLEKVSSDIDACKGQRHNTSGQMSQIKQSLERNKCARKTIQEVKKTMKNCSKNMVATNLLKKAWSRYGIPLQLTEALSKKIEDRASSVYQEFDNGRIEVRKVEDRGKPGMQFYLADRKGARTFNQLSMGEKVMFFISVRVAIAQIVSVDSPLTVDFLILDEVMANLSPKSRDNLIRLVNKVLRKIFPQLLMVSHTPMRDIFSQTITVTAENDVSSIEVA